jgi:hypothetical protein
MCVDICVVGSADKVAQRGKKNEKREDFLINLRRLTLVHEMGGNEEVFRFQEGCVLFQRHI